MHWVQRMLRSSMRDEPEAVRLTETHGGFKKERGQLCPRVDPPHFPKRADKAVRAPFVRFLNPPWENPKPTTGGKRPNEHGQLFSLSSPGGEGRGEEVFRWQALKKMF